MKSNQIQNTTRPFLYSELLTTNVREHINTKHKTRLANLRLTRTQKYQTSLYIPYY